MDTDRNVKLAASHQRALPSPSRQGRHRLRPAWASRRQSDRSEDCRNSVEVSAFLTPIIPLQWAVVDGKQLRMAAGVTSIVPCPADGFIIQSV